MLGGIAVQREGTSPHWRIESLRARAIRLVIPHWWDPTAYLQEINQRGYDVLAVMDRDAFSDWSNWRTQAEADFERLAALADRGLIGAIAVGNEFDDGWAGPGMSDDPLVSPRGGVASWVMSFAEISEMVTRASEVFHGRVPLVLGGMSSGQPAVIDYLDLSQVQAIQVHPYGKRPQLDWPNPGWGTGYIGWLLDPLRQKLDERGLSETCRMLIGELGLSTYDTDKGTAAEWFARMLNYLNLRCDIDATFVFCDSDLNVDGYGQFDVSDRPKPQVATVSEMFARFPADAPMIYLPQGLPGAPEEPVEPPPGSEQPPIIQPSPVTRSLRHAGLHWPENADGEHPDRDSIIAYPGIKGPNGAALICSPSARYHYNHLRANSDSVVVWRAIPRKNRLPALLLWDPERVAEECLNLWDEQVHYPDETEWFLPLNELQFERENGGPFPGYAAMAQSLEKLRVELRRQFDALGLPNTKLMFPAWVPSDDGSNEAAWLWAARKWDAVCLHAYGSAETMRSRYDGYRNALGPDMPIFVGEWNANHEGHDEAQALEMWADVAQADPQFMGAAYYIYETRNEGEGDLSIYGNEARAQLFSAPPMVIVEEPEPQPEPEPPIVIEPEPEPSGWWDGHFSDIDIATCLASVRTQLGRPTEVNEVIGDIQENWPEFAAFLTPELQGDVPTKIALLATIFVETAYEFRPIDEYGSWEYFERMYGPQTAVGQQLGNVYYGDGAKYHGRGLIQITGRNNYRYYGELLEVPLEDMPDEAKHPTVAAAVMVAYFVNHNIPAMAQAGNWDQVRRAVNGGLNGYQNFLLCVQNLQGYADAESGEPSAPPRELAPLLQRVIDVGETRIGDPYVWDGERPGGFDCSGFVAWANQQANGITITSYTDAIYDETDAISRAESYPGDILLYEYYDPSQPQARFPHIGLVAANPDLTLDARYGHGVGYHAHVQGAVLRYRRVRGLSETQGDQEEKMWREKAEGLINALGYLGGDVADKLEGARARIDDYGEKPTMPKPPSRMTKADWQAYAAEMDAWAAKVSEQTGLSYEEIGKIGTEIRRVKKEFTG